MQNAARPKARLNTGQMIDLMRLEVERALRQSYPISCIVVGLEGYDTPEEATRRRELMIEVFGHLKQVCFSNDVRGLGVWTMNYELAVFPHVDPEACCGLTEQLLEASRAIETGGDPVKLSVGVAHNLHPGDVSFESMVEEAETGMRLALSAGSNRLVQAREVESEVDKLREEIQRQITDLEETASQPGAIAEANDWGKPLLAGLRHVFQKHDPGHDERIARLQQDVFQLVKTSVEDWRTSDLVSKMNESRGQIQRLERRVTKLTDSLGVTETELRRVAALKNIDVGVSSLYRTVQGLSEDDPESGAKKEMLKTLFDANVALRQAVVKKSQD